MIEVYKLMNKVLSTGRHLPCRNDSHAVSLFGETLEIDLQMSFPILTMRKIDYKQAFGELAAFLQGCTKASEFSELGCNYWNSYGEELGPIYGYQWRHWGPDQLLKLIASLKQDPFSRRHILAAWNNEDLDKMVLPPCHLTVQYDIDALNRLNSMVYMRSVDLALGLPYDLIIYATLQRLLAYECNYIPGKMKFVFGNAHIYGSHVETVLQMLDEYANKTTQARVTSTRNIELQLNFAPSECILDFDGTQATVHGYNADLPVFKFALLK